MSGELSRRQCVKLLAACGVTLAHAACRGGAPTDDGDGEGLPGSPDDGSVDGAACVSLPPGDRSAWIEVSSAARRELAASGAAAVDDDDALVHVWLVATGDDCYRAVWRICTHGACELGVDVGAGHLACPCHGSLFGFDGRVSKGPATVPLRVLEVGRDGAALFIRKPFG